MASLKLGGLDIGNEVLNTKVNIDTILTLLARKGYITQKEYVKIKKEIIDTYYSEYTNK